jgi:hypothetical protein
MVTTLSPIMFPEVCFPASSASFAGRWSLAKVPVYPLNINKPIREDFRYQSSLPAQLSQNITEFIAVFLIVGIINT